MSNKLEDDSLKKEYSVIPSSMVKMETYGFSWMDFVTAIPSPLFVVTSETFTGKAHDFIAVLHKFRDMGEY
jgi:hypothetical protein